MTMIIFKGDNALNQLENGCAQPIRNLFKDTVTTNGANALIDPDPKETRVLHSPGSVAMAHIKAPALGIVPILPGSLRPLAILRHANLRKEIDRD